MVSILTYAQKEQMRKEVVFAIIAGILAGLSLAFGIWKISSKVTEVVTSPKPTTQEEPPSPTPPFLISLNTPKNQTVSVDEKINVSGTTSPNSWVVISTKKDDYLIKSESSGTFTKSVSLSSGFNHLNITVFSENSQQTTSSVDIVYSSEFSKYQVEGSSRVATFYTGGITDINGSAVQIQADKGGIGQLTLSPDTTFVKIKKPQNTTEAIKQTDLAIGDYIIAMGYTNGTTAVLDTKRVLVGTLEKNTKIAVSGTLTNITKKTITLATSTEEEMEITLPKTWTGPDIGDLEIDQKVIITGVKNEDGSISLLSILELDE